jgi:diacylglycerol kinase family enzyme
MQGPGPDSADDAARRRLTVVYHPVKVDDLDGAKELLAAAAARHGWETPRWVETTEDEPGQRQAREAVEAGAHVVASLGGDGTVRAVAAALVGTDVALGLLPGGTGNLLARNLGLPVDSLESAVDALLTGSDRRIDVGFVTARGGTADAQDEEARSEEWVGDEARGAGATAAAGSGSAAASDSSAAATAESRPVATAESSPVATAESSSSGTGDDSELVFLVMTGLGLDGEVMAETNESVKAAVGWVAYVLAGVKRLAGRGFSVTVSTDEGSITRHARAVVVGNCGTLQGGIELLPDARVDDGILDSVVVAPKGPVGWVSVLADVATRHRAGHGRLDRLRGARLTVEARRPVEAEVDGEAIGPRRRLDIRVEPESLVVRGG